jgi:dTDP-4-amino-4,6-dideoxygalactose transaminase
MTISWAFAFVSEMKTGTILKNFLSNMDLGDDRINVTRPFLPPLEEFIPYLEEIWMRGRLTNKGPFHEDLEQALCTYLGVNYISLFTNGTLALITALQALRITGEVITTPFSFVATAHALHWNGIKPVFCDIEADTLTLNPDKIEAAINPQTTAILPVHVYGNPCKVEDIQKIADIYGWKVIYDAAHAFSVNLNGSSILNFGDLSVLSFHATKVFTTFEGGALVCQDKKMKQRIDFLKNFGFAGEVTVVGPGINAKMSEIQAAFGLLQLKYIEKVIKKRRSIVLQYRKKLLGIKGLSFFDDQKLVKHNYAYFPILINESEYGRSRDETYEKLKRNNIYARRYFYPLISQFPTYRGLASSSANNLPVAVKTSKRVICLPIYPDLKESEIEKVVSILS